jgi:hypothetical protein
LIGELNDTELEKQLINDAFDNIVGGFILEANAIDILLN